LTRGRLPLHRISSGAIGAQHQADVVAVHWRTHQVLVGEAKWTDEPADHKVWTELNVRTAKVVQRLKAADPENKPKQEPKPWQVHLMVFARHGVTAALRTEAKKTNARIMTFADILRDLERLQGKRIR
jgi:hypothetical protein